MRLLRKFTALSSDERRLLVRALLFASAIQLVLGRLPFTMLRRIVVRDRGSVGHVAGTDPSFPDRVVWAVTVASRRAPGSATCLSRALMVHAMLARRGYPSRLHIGVVRARPRALEAHAWVEREGRILIGGTVSQIGEFTPLAAFGPETSHPRSAVESMRAGR